MLCFKCICKVVSLLIKILKSLVLLLTESSDRLLISLLDFLGVGCSKAVAAIFEL